MTGKEKRECKRKNERAFKGFGKNRRQRKRASMFFKRLMKKRGVEWRKRHEIAASVNTMTEVAMLLGGRTT